MVTARTETEGKTELLYAGNQGKRVGETRIYLDDATRDIRSTNTSMHLLTARYPHVQSMLDYVNKIAENAKTAAPRPAVGASGAARR